MKNSRFIDSWWIYFLLWCIYLLQGILLSNYQTIAQGILVLLVMWSFAHAVICHVKFKLTRFLYVLDILLLLFSLYGVILIVGNNSYFNRNGDIVSNYSYLRNIYISLLPIYSFFFYSAKGQVGIEEVKKSTVLLFSVAVLAFFQYQTHISIAEDATFGEITNNQAYSFLSLLPCVMLFRNRIVRYVGLVLCTFFIFMSMKRGAIIIGAVCLMIFLFKIYRASNSGGKALTIIATCIISFFIYKLVLYEYDTNAYFGYRVEQTMEGSSSGRDELVDRLLDIYKERFDFSQQLFGAGANATVKYISKYAHNDWIEILINQGILGVLIYIFYWATLLKSWRKLVSPRLLHDAFGMLILILFLKTMFSMSYSDVGLYGSILLGYCIYVCSLNTNERDKISV